MVGMLYRDNGRKGLPAYKPLDAELAYCGWSGRARTTVENEKVHVLSKCLICCWLLGMQDSAMLEVLDAVESLSVKAKRLVRSTAGACNV
jgi:hypothetical protein